MSVWLRREKALECPIHAAVREEASKRLENMGVFNKDEVLDALRFSAVRDAIRWDYIREFIQEDQGCELVPLSSAYFTRHTYKEEQVNPEKFLAQGHGKKTSGYAAVTLKNDHLVIARIKYREKTKNGVDMAFKNFVQEIQQQRRQYLPPQEGEVLPPLREERVFS